MSPVIPTTLRLYWVDCTANFGWQAISIATMGVSMLIYIDPFFFLVFRFLVLGFSILFGLFLLFFPKKSIEIQVAMYKPFNWDIRPFDWNREIRSMKRFGFGLLLISLIAMGFIFF